MNKTEQQIYELLSPIANRIGYNIVKITFNGKIRKVLDIMIERVDGNNISISDCKNATNNFSTAIDVEEIIPTKYYLEVSSAGSERPLVKLEDYKRFAGRKAFIKLYEAINDVRNLKADISEVDGEKITFIRDSGENFIVNFNNIKTANLIFTDEMYKEIIKQNKKKRGE